ncbi:MAG TPA: hypothetical protein VMV18_06500, partial [bacterium]|nr:hypothetical protein [bacterium]
MSGRAKKKDPREQTAQSAAAANGPGIAESAGPKAELPIAKVAPSIATTPLMKQYLSIKAQHTDAILFFRMGDFYEMFFEDAEVAARELDITLTARDKNAGERVPLAGFPHHQLQPYVTKLLARGYKIAICDQTEDPKESRAKGKAIVERAVSRVLTPGLVVDEESLEAKAPSFLASVSRRGARVGLAFLDISTGELSVTEVDGDEEAWAEIERLRPRELLLPAAPGDLRARGPKIDPSVETGDPLSTRAVRAVPPIPVTPRPSSEFESGRAGEVVKGQLGVVTLDGQGLAGMDAAIGAAGAALAYARENARATLAHVRRVKPYTRAEALLVDEATRRNLEIFEASGGGRKGSLLDVMDATVTPMGGRTLRAWLASPLLDARAIGARLDAVESLVAEPLAREEIRTELAGVYDLPRIVGRVAAGVAGPRDLKALRESLGRIPALKSLVSGVAQSKKTRGEGAPLAPGRLAPLSTALDPCEDVAKDLRDALADDPPLRLSDGGVIREGFDAELDEIHAIARDA